MRPCAVAPHHSWDTSRTYCLECAKSRHWLNDPTEHRLLRIINNEVGAPSLWYDLETGRRIPSEGGIDMILDTLGYKVEHAYSGIPGRQWYHHINDALPPTFKKFLASWQRITGYPWHGPQ